MGDVDVCCPGPFDEFGRKADGYAYYFHFELLAPVLFN
jgi:hypothetical protein